MSILFYKKWQEIDFQVAFEDGTSTCNYALASSQERGQMFIGPGAEVYKGQLVGIHQRPGDLLFNIMCARKRLLLPMYVHIKNKQVRSRFSS